MKKTLLILIAGFAAILPTQNLHALAAKDSRLIAVFLTAQDCEISKGLAPKFESLKTQFGQEPVLFVTLDHSTAADRNQSAMLAQALDMDEVYNQQNRESGVLILLDTASEKEAARITPEMTDEQAKETVTQLLAAPQAQ